MNQLVFKFPFKTKYYEQDYYVSSNNFSVYRLIESWPNWPDKCLNIYGPKGCGKTHLSNILKKRIKAAKILEAKEINNQTMLDLETIDCLIIDNYKQNINEKLFYSILNHLKQLDKFVVINSLLPIKDIKFNLKDLKSRFDIFVSLGIDLPTDDLLRVIISKSFSDKQIDISPKKADFDNHVIKTHQWTSRDIECKEEYDEEYLKEESPNWRED